VGGGACVERCLDGRVGGLECGQRVVGYLLDRCIRI
jgi:hypothetical protein